jgi:hypothetical protein
MSVYRASTTVRPIQTPFTGDSILEIGREAMDQGKVHGQMLLLLTLAIAVGVALFGLSSFLTRMSVISDDVQSREAVLSDPAAGRQQSDTETGIKRISSLAPVFTDEVKRWESNIVHWSNIFDLDPDLAAVIMQIESCGDPLAVSGAGASGLFQVMPFHFTTGENVLDPETNARRGLAYFSERLVQTQGDIGLAFAGYNGGHVAAATGWDSWVQETRDYYVWATGIYDDAKSGLKTSPTLERWLQAGGASLCRQAAEYPVAGYSVGDS